MKKYNVIVTAEPTYTGKVNVSIGQPEGEDKLSFLQISHILASGISLLIKLINEESGQKDYELMKQIIEHLNHEFISLSAFDDAKIIK